MATATCTISQKDFDKDLARHNAAIEKAGAVVTWPDGFRSVDEDKIPAALARSYRGLLSFGYANGLLP